MINWYTPAVVSNTSPSGVPVTTWLLRRSKVLPRFLYLGGLTPTVNTASGTGALTVTASQSSFTMLMPIWGTALNAPSASTSIPF